MQLAERSGISQHSISKLETGRTQPKPETLEKLARALGVEDPKTLISNELGYDGIVSFAEILEATPEQRLRHFALSRELENLDAFEASLHKHYTENVERWKDHPEYISSKLEAALMLGYVMGLREGRQDRGGNGET